MKPGKYLNDFSEIKETDFLTRRVAGAVERDGLENRCAFTGTQGSNP
jgi:hypothetical protein